MGAVRPPTVGLPVVWKVDSSGSISFAAASHGTEIRIELLAALLRMKRGGAADAGVPWLDVALFADVLGVPEGAFRRPAPQTPSLRGSSPPLDAPAG